MGTHGQQGAWPETAPGGGLLNENLPARVWRAGAWSPDLTSSCQPCRRPHQEGHVAASQGRGSSWGREVTAAGRELNPQMRGHERPVRGCELKCIVSGKPQTSPDVTQTVPVLHPRQSRARVQAASCTSRRPCPATRPSSQDSGAPRTSVGRAPAGPTPLAQQRSPPTPSHPSVSFWGTRQTRAGSTAPRGRAEGTSDLGTALARHHLGLGWGQAAGHAQAVIVVEAWPSHVTPGPVEQPGRRRTPREGGRKEGREGGFQLARSSTATAAAGGWHSPPASVSNPAGHRAAGRSPSQRPLGFSGCSRGQLLQREHPQGRQGEGWAAVEHARPGGRVSGWRAGHCSSPHRGGKPPAGTPGGQSESGRQEPKTHMHPQRGTDLGDTGFQGRAAQGSGQESHGEPWVGESKGLAAQRVGQGAEPRTPRPSGAGS